MTTLSVVLYGIILLCLIVFVSFCLYALWARWGYNREIKKITEEHKTEALKCLAFLRKANDNPAYLRYAPEIFKFLQGEIIRGGLLLSDIGTNEEELRRFKKNIRPQLN